MQNLRFLLYLPAFLPLLLPAQQPRLIIPAGPAGQITACRFSDNEKYLASADEAGQIILWDIATGRELRHFSSSIELTGLAISPDNRLIAGCSRDCTIEIWNIASGQAAWKNKVEFTRIVNLSFSPDGQFLLSETDNRHFQLWETGSGRLLRELEGSCADFRHHSGQVVIGSEALYLMEPYSGRKKLLYTGKDTIRQARFSSENELTLLADTVAICYDVRKKKVIRRFSIAWPDEHGAPILPIDPFERYNQKIRSDELLSELTQWISPDGSRILQVYQTNGPATVREWDTQNGQLFQKQAYLTDGQYTKSYLSPGGSLLMSTILDNSVGTPGEFWFTDARTGHRQTQISARGTYSQAGLSPQGSQLYLKSYYMESAPGLAGIWQLDGLKLLLKEEEQGRSRFEFTRHENISFWESAYADGTLAWKNHATGDTLWKVNTDPDSYWGDYSNTAFGLDDSGKRLAAGLPGGMLSLWEAGRPGSPHWSASLESQKIDWVRFSGQGGRLATYAGGRFQGWRIPPPPGVLDARPPGPYPEPNPAIPRPAPALPGETDPAAPIPAPQAPVQPVSPSGPEPVFDTPLPGYGPAACWISPSGERVIAARETPGGQKPEISLFELNALNGELKLLRTIPMDSLTAANGIRSLEITPNGKYLIAQGSYDMQDYLGESMGKAGYWASIRDIGNGKLTASFPDLQKPFIGLSPDGRYAFLLRPNAVEVVDVEKDSLALTFITIDKDWAVVAPSGLFDASPGAMKLMYFTLGLETVELEQLKERYYEPGLMQKLLGFSDEPIRSVEGFDTIALYPIVSMQLDTQTHQLQIGLTPRNGGLGKVSVFVNGKEVIEDANPPQGFERQRSASINVRLAQYSRYFLQDSLNTISVRAYNQTGWLKSPAHTVAYRPRFARSRGSADDTAPSVPFVAIRDPALYAIIIGTANYAGEKLDLKFPGKDAAAMASAIRQAGGQLFGGEVHIRLFTTDTTDAGMHPTKANIRAAFDGLKAQAMAEDILLVYLSGHGVAYGDAERAQFYYLTQDIGSEDLSDEGVRNTRAISSAELTKWINDIPAQKQVMILDACNSGRVVEILESGAKNLNSTQIRALDRMKDRTGMYVLAGSAADKVSYEASQYGQGLLTYSLLEWMKYHALEEDATVDVVRLFEYARDRVPDLAAEIGGVQTPTMATPGSGGFAIGLINEKVEIPLPQAKPVFIRNIFLDEELLTDHLQLSRHLEDTFQEITARGTKAELIYVDVSRYPHAYSVRGLYSARQGTVQGRGRLFRGEEPVGSFTFSGTADRPAELGITVLQKVQEMLAR